MALAVVAGLYCWTAASRVLLFWLAFILTRPLGATVEDFLDKPINHGGLALSRPWVRAGNPGASTFGRIAPVRRSLPTRAVLRRPPGGDANRRALGTENAPVLG
jgi:repeat uncharacterized protein DUF347